MRQLFIGLVAEGNTDVRFLKNIIYNSIQDISWECDNQFDLSEIKVINASGESFVEKMLNASIASAKQGISILCIHADSDNRSIQPVMDNKFIPFLKALSEFDGVDICKFVVPTVPVQMVEAWMLADKELFKQLINARGIRDVDLGIEKDPEHYSDPKLVLENAIRVSMQKQPKKRRDQISISDLYEILGNRLSLAKLRHISSFLLFEEGIRNTFRKMGLMSALFFFLSTPLLYLTIS